jgi:uncharacterized protein (TIGR03435 family)
MSKRSAGLLVLTIAAYGQAPAAAPHFEVASVKLATISTRARSARSLSDASRFELSGTTLPALIRRAYRLEPYQNVTGPDWMNKQYFDVMARLPAGATKDQVPEMLQALLADRLKLVIRRENKEEIVCILTVGKNGPKLKEAAPNADPAKWVSSTGAKTPVLRQATPHGILTYSRLNGILVLDASKMTLPDLAAALRKEVNLPVLDRTGLQGFYEVSLFVPGTWMRAAPRPREDVDLSVASDPEGVDIYKSITRLGLKLVKAKAPIEHLVVEHAEKVPTDN